MRLVRALLLILAFLLAGVWPAGLPLVGAQSPTPPQGQRALVLGGGGITGTAWEAGMLKGLRDAGIDLTQADLIVGTSAGSIIGTQVRLGRSLDALYDAQLVPPTAASATAAPSFDPQYFQETSRMWQGIATTDAQRIEVGRRALAAPRAIPEDEAIQGWVAVLGTLEWPSQPLQITAIDVLDGTRRLIDRTQGVEIARAVAASTTLPGRNAPITIGDRRYMDGGVGGTHVDAAAGYRLIVGLLPGGGPGTEREVEEVSAQGSQVMIIRPDAESAAARGTNSMDPTRRAVSAEAGLRQAAAVAADLHTFWNETSPSR